MPVQYKDYYATLGVPKGSSQDEIRKAFRRLARQHHPDVSKDKKNAESKFKDINEAYEVLGDAEKRKRYDELGADWDRKGPQPPPGWDRGEEAGSFGGTGFSDFFEQFFSGAASRGGGVGVGGQGRGFSPFGGMGGMGGMEEEPLRGRDIEADLLVTIEEALHGAKKKVSFRRDAQAPMETYEVRIPKGVHEGQKIRLAGQGQSSRAGRKATAGDMYLVVRFERHPDFRVEGSDLHYDFDVPAWLAVLGGELSVPTPEGAVRLKIPAGSQSGRKFRLKGRGLPISKDSRGDFYACLNVKLPESLGEEERTLWEKLSEIEAE
jgi:curved DNA-binding protein